MGSRSSPFRVLSLDGGGMRGVYAATYLERMANAFARQRSAGQLDVGAGFNLIVGTSTGGIIACGLAAGIPLEKVIKLYRQHGSAIFQRRLPKGFLGLTMDMYKRPPALERGNGALRDALHEMLGERTIKDIYDQREIALAVTAVEMGQHDAWVFKTPHSSATNHRDDNCTLVDVCLATSAAPIFRSMANINCPVGNGSEGGNNVFADGGLWANNPVLIGLIEALEMADPGQAIEVFCLGTCPVPNGEQIMASEVHRGLSGWKFGGGVVSLAIDAQRTAYDHMAKKLAHHISESLGRKCSVLRFPATQVPTSLTQYLELDDTRDEAINALVSQAQADANATNSKFSYEGTDPEAALIRGLFNSMPACTASSFKALGPLSKRPSPSAPTRKDASHA